MNPEKRTSWFLRGVRSLTLMLTFRRTATRKPGEAWRTAVAVAGVRGAVDERAADGHLRSEQHVALGEVEDRVRVIGRGRQRDRPDGDDGRHGKDRPPLRTHGAVHARRTVRPNVVGGLTRAGGRARAGGEP